MGRIASSPIRARQHSSARRSKPLPAFPEFSQPVLIDVEAQGKRFAEMHVDGGTITSNVLVVPEAMLASNRPIVTKCAARESMSS